MLDGLCHKLSNELWLHGEEMITFLRDKYEVEVSVSRTTWTLQSRKWSKKIARGVARQTYSPDGIVLSRIVRGSTDHVMFEDFIKQLLCHCGKFSQRKSVLEMDNASFYRDCKVRELCSATGTEVLFLPAYLPGLNPVEEHLREVEGLTRKE
ncbi:unnamed protein product [Fusarium graminearum]|nr:unnamed protein product [Fusarium graminearum]